jgi:EAL domain-containing protein (putative c-di-GMP-specific phosphodiesterase class I)
MRPDHFIGHAEVTGDIVRIGTWVLREACRQVCEWRESGLGIVRIAVNVSYRQFLGDDLAQVVGNVLQEFSLPGSALELEFTERVLIEDAPDTIKAFADLRTLGVMLTIDDFGEGYSALNYLRRLPIHGLKLSQLFVHGVPSNKSMSLSARPSPASRAALDWGWSPKAWSPKRNASSCCSSACRSARASCSHRACCPTSSRDGSTSLP